MLESNIRMNKSNDKNETNLHEQERRKREHQSMMTGLPDSRTSLNSASPVIGVISIQVGFGSPARTQTVNLLSCLECQVLSLLQWRKKRTFKVELLFCKPVCDNLPWDRFREDATTFRVLLAFKPVGMRSCAHCNAIVQLLQSAIPYLITNEATNIYCMHIPSFKLLILNQNTLNASLHSQLAFQTCVNKDLIQLCENSSSITESIHLWIEGFNEIWNGCASQIHHSRSNHSRTSKIV